MALNGINSVGATRSPPDRSEQCLPQMNKPVNPTSPMVWLSPVVWRAADGELLRHPALLPALPRSGSVRTHHRLADEHLHLLRFTPTPVHPLSGLVLATWTMM